MEQKKFHHFRQYKKYVTMLNPYIYNVDGWSSSLKTNLVSVFEFNETSGTSMFDSLNGSTFLSKQSSALINQTGILDKSVKIVSGSGFISDSASRSNYNIYNAVNVDTPKSISMWVNLYDVATTGYVFFQGDEGVVTYYYAVYNATTKLLLFLIYDGTTPYANYMGCSIPFNPAINTWYHLVFTYNGNKNITGSGVNISVNNVLGTPTYIYDNGYTYSHNNSAKNFSLGIRSDFNFYVPMYVDQLSIWNKELTSSDKLELYNVGLGKKYQ